VKENSEAATPAERDDSAFVSLLTSHQNMIFAYLTAILPGESELDDILQNANIVLWEKRDQFQRGTNFKAWALTIAYWQARAWMTARKRKSWLLFDDELAATITERFTTQSQPGPSSLHSALHDCLEKLRDRDRLLILSHHQHDKDLRECSRIFDLSVDSLKVTLFRIRAALRRCINSKLAVEGLDP
jgi:RNA polymerase sigma-70 factor (ECF subfamily)